MRSAINEFLSFFARPNPRFECDVPELTSYEEMLQKLEKGDKDTMSTFNWAKKHYKKTGEAIKAQWQEFAEIERGQVRASIPLTHEFFEPAKPATLVKLKEALRGASDTLFELYVSHDGAQIYVDQEDPETGIYFISLSEMNEALSGIREWFEGLDDDPEPEQDEQGMEILYSLPDWFDSSICFGAVACAAERFILAVDGPFRGSVFRFDHDPLCLIQVTRSFDEFLKLLTTEPVAFVAGQCGYYDAIAFSADS